MTTENLQQLGIEKRPFSPNTQKAEAEGFLCVQGQAGLHSQMLSQKKGKKKKPKTCNQSS